MPYPVAAVRNKNWGNASYSGALMTLSPIAYWPLNEASGTAAVNLVSTTLNGAYTGVDLAQAQAPFTCPFWDGLNDVCNIYSAALNTANPKSEGSVAAWMKVYNAGVWTDGTQRYVFSMATSGPQERIWMYKTTSNGVFQFTSRVGGTEKGVSASSQSSTAWMHVAMTWSDSGDAMIAYINGAQTGATQTGIGTGSANNLVTTTSCIGAGSTTPTLIWHGWIAHVALWNRPLTPTEVANLYAWGL